MFQLIIQEEALIDIQDTYVWHEEQLPNLGEDFLSELNIVFDKLKHHPQHYGYAFDDFRDVRINRFPYLVVFRIEKKKVFINSIKHTKREPRSEQ